MGGYVWVLSYNDIKYKTISYGYKIGGKIVLGVASVKDLCAALNRIFNKMIDGIYSESLQLGSVSAQSLSSSDARITIIDDDAKLATMTWNSLLSILDNHYQKK
jgi:hypothetical protein